MALLLPCYRRRGRLTTHLKQPLDRRLSPGYSLNEQSFNKNVAKGGVSSVIPYRGVVRQLTGAEKRARSRNDALLAGTVRRAYLKGYAEMLRCGELTSPISHVDEE